MKIVVGGQIDKERVASYLKNVLPEYDIEIKTDLEAAMGVKNGEYKYYFGACNTGGGGALAMAIAILGMDKCLTVSSPGHMISESEIEKAISNGKIAFGFTPNTAEQSINIIKNFIK